MKRVNGASDRARSNVKREHSDRRNLRDRFYCTVLPLERSLIEVGTGRVSAPHFRISRSDKRDKGRPISRIRSVFRSPLFFFFFYRYYSDNMYIYIFVCELLFTLRGILRLEILSVSRNRYHSGKNIVRWTMVTRSGRASIIIIQRTFLYRNIINLSNSCRL